ncbi:hypothetical protein [Rhodococcus opacus]|uniref:hypothetical protein n=1 Tax=Rhodococcus opacus TaxID=37919 RepID=UPI0026D101EF
MGLAIAVADPAVLAELDEWWQMVETRPNGNSTKNPGLGLDHSIRYLTDRLDADTITPEALGECCRRIAAVDQTIASAKDLPDLAHPDAEMLDLLARYLKVRSRVLALAREPTGETLPTRVTGLDRRRPPEDGRVGFGAPIVGTCRFPWSQSVLTAVVQRFQSRSNVVRRLGEVIGGRPVAVDWGVRGRRVSARRPAREGERSVRLRSRCPMTPGVMWIAIAAESTTVGG